MPEVESAGVAGEERLAVHARMLARLPAEAEAVAHETRLFVRSVRSPLLSSATWRLATRIVMLKLMTVALVLRIPLRMSLEQAEAGVA